jgi:hypothetical protein
MTPEEQAKQKALAERLRKLDPFKSDQGIIIKPKPTGDAGMVHTEEELREKRKQPIGA